MPAGSDHLRLGLSLEALARFIKRIDFPCSSTCLGFRKGSYIRPDDKLAWVTAVYGEELTGYDFAHAVRIFLKQIEKTHMSALEVLLEEADPNIGDALVFYSHWQRWSIDHTAQGMSKALSVCKDQLPRGERGILFWLDYLTIRQCQKDFNLGTIQACIGGIGCTVAEVTHMAYLERSFCIFEVYATVDGNASLYVCTGMFPDTVRRSLNHKPVCAEMARAMSDEDKKKIDDYIRLLPGGFDSFNMLVADAIVAGAAAGVSAGALLD